MSSTTEKSPQPASDFPLVYVVTVNWNRRQDTLECLESLARVDYPNLRLLVVDNGSSDGSARAVAGRFPQVELICHATNLGFAGGYNAGMRHALQNGADYVMILNNDTTLAPQSIPALLRHAAPDTGILAPVIYYAHLKEKIWSCGGRINHWNLEQSHTLQDQPDPGEWPDFIEQDFVTGCCMFFPRQALQEVGLFDESFQLYYEDSDLCRRVRRAGLRIRVIPEARVWHKIASSSGGSDSPNERYWMARSSIRFFRKHARGLQIPAVIFWRAGSAIRTTWRLAGQRNRQSLRAYWRGLKDGLKDGFREARKR